MGYRPWDNVEDGLQQRVSDFLHACVEWDVPIFTHCSPRGFQAKKGWGLNSNPKYWANALAQETLKGLRLCLGHAGGGKQKNTFDGNELESWGWNAQTPDQWDHDDNFARTVVDLCRTYENVYCGTGHLDDALHPSRRTSTPAKPNNSPSFFLAMRLMR